MSTYGRVKDSKTEADEHVSIKGVHAKRVLQSGWDGQVINDIDVNDLGESMFRLGRADRNLLRTLRLILKQLKIANMHFSIMTDTFIDKTEVWNALWYKNI